MILKVDHHPNIFYTMSQRIIAFFLIAFLTKVSPVACQEVNNAAKVKILDNYINFANEGTHGLLLVHRLLDKFNKNINKYVDLPDQQINFYSNKDLPTDIFEDPEKMFYDVSPNMWYKRIEAEKGKLPSNVETNLNKSAAEMKRLLVAINDIRFQLDEQIKILDLTKRENLSLVYDKLEEGVILYKDYYKHQLELEKEINNYYKTLKFTANDIQFPKVINAMHKLYDTNRKALNALYFKEDDNFNDLIKNEEKAFMSIDSINLADYNSTRLINSKVQMWWTNMKKQSSSSIAAQKDFAQSENIPEEYKLYDKYYYYYNFPVIDKFNRYGMGMVFEMNRIIDYLAIPVLREFEMPHYFKVFYPKLLEKTEYLAASDPVIKVLPKEVRGRSVVTATRTIKVDSAIVDFKMYDHKIIDKDVVSLSFNGDWIIEKFQISEKPFEFTLKLNTEGKNFLLLHADEMGRQPPATIALSYKYKGKKEVIILNSDIRKSEVIEIITQ